MASPSFGVNFMPSGQENGDDPRGLRGGAPRSPVQEAVKILSLRLPKFYGSQSIAPGLLLNSPGGMGQPAARGNVTAQALQQMAGLPPSMKPPQVPAPFLPPQTPGHGSDSDPYGDWMRRERDMSRPQSPAPTSDPDPTPAPTPWQPPTVRPGQEAPSGQGLNDPPPIPFDLTPQLPETPPLPASGFERPDQNARKYLELLDSLSFLGGEY